MAPPTALNEGLDELELLARTAGAVVLGRLTQRLDRVHGATFIGKGKVAELKEMAERMEADLVIFDDDLSTVQIRNLEKTLECKIIDRSGLILDIFASHARTATAKAQVEIAQLQYLTTRLTRQWTHLSRQKGGIGTKGPGEKQIETDRRLIGRRIAVLKKKLAQIDKQRATQRKSRQNEMRISLVGYTNAGKSTLMNTLTGADVLTENKLFATLDATTRSVEISKGVEILLTDTVGFIRKLPHSLIESFQSTLDEVRESDLLIHVVDASHPGYEDMIAVVAHTLNELDCHDKPQLMVLNKVDAIQDPVRLEVLRAEFSDAVMVSALRGIGVSALKERIASLISETFEEKTIFLSLTDSKARARIHDLAEVLAEDYVSAPSGDGGSDETMVRLRVRASKSDYVVISRLTGDSH